MSFADTFYKEGSGELVLIDDKKEAKGALQKVLGIITDIKNGIIDCTIADDIIKYPEKVIPYVKEIPLLEVRRKLMKALCELEIQSYLDAFKDDLSEKN